MSDPSQPPAPDADRSWTVAPVFLAFIGFAVIGVIAVDGDASAITERLTAPRTAPLAGGNAPGPAAFAPKLPEVAERDTGEDDHPAQAGGSAAPDAIKPGPDRTKTGSLEDQCTDGQPASCKRWALDGFYKAIAKTKANTLGRALRISWYGDSVVATDAIPGRLRTRIQADLGYGGPGFVFLAPPHRFVGHEAMVRTNTGDWQAHAISTIQIADGLYGPGGSTAETRDGAASIKLVDQHVAKLGDLYYLAQPHGGTVTITADGTEAITVDTAEDAKAARYKPFATEGATTWKLETKGKVRAFGLALENAGGAVVDNFGIVSVNVKSFGNTDTAHWTAELAHRDADLIIVMIGANEAQWLGPGDQDTKAYAANYERLLAPIKAARPSGGACLVISPTDQAEAKDGAYPSRPVMPVLVAAQRKAAAALGCGFFSTYDWMGGKGSAQTWFAKGYVGSDFQHLTRKGANKFADAVYDTLLAGFARYAGAAANGAGSGSGG